MASTPSVRAGRTGGRRRREEALLDGTTVIDHFGVCSTTRGHMGILKGNCQGQKFEKHPIEPQRSARLLSDPKFLIQQTSEGSWAGA
uniref:Uncharacterized protein n=1 Tax=Oryza nivara TaxID=4536 RepID=A0A0E0HPK0_ORYNI